MRVLVTGGLGFVTINLVLYLARSGQVEQVIAADVAEPDRQAMAFLDGVGSRVRFERLDVADPTSVMALVANMGVTHIVHGAAITPNEEQERAQPGLIVDVNLGGAINVLRAALATPAVTRVLLVSSSGVYGAPPAGFAGMQDEQGPLHLNNLYAITKYSAELLGQRFAELSTLSVASVRLAAIYGPMERGTGSRGRTSQPQRLMAALQAGQIARVAGPAVPRDWCYAADAAAAMGLLLTAPVLHHPVYNVGSGTATELRDVVAAFEDYGLRAEWVEDPSSATVALRPDQARAALDLSRLNADTGYRPGYDILAGVAEYLAEEARLAQSS